MDELTENPRWGQNVIDKANMKIFIPVLAFERRSGICFIMFQVKQKKIFIEIAQGDHLITVLGNVWLLKNVGTN